MQDDAAAPVAPTRHGVVSGERRDGVVRFRGIPFAGRLDGPARFARAPNPPRWDGVRPCTEWAPMTPQVPDGAHRDHPFYTDYLFGRSHPLRMTEDGLYLNLWTPSLDPGAACPVLVWLHGGGFTTGAATRPREDGAALAREGLVVVAPAHRLGVFGYAWPDHDGRGPDGSPDDSNVGLLDIVAALRWVQDNIASFGGDPDNITIMGESGGAMKVSALLAMPSARGLFHRAVCLGGALVRNHAAQANTPEQGRALMERLARHLGVAVGDLRAMPASALIEGQAATDRRPLVWRPVIDGTLLPDHPDIAIAGGRGAPVPLLVGSSAHEGDFLSLLGPSFDVQAPSDLARIAGDHADAVAPAYRGNGRAGGQAESGRHAAVAMLGDYYIRMAGLRIADRHAGRGHPTYAYLFDWTQPRAPHLRSTHGAETVFVFGNLDATGAVRGFEEAEALSRQVRDAWIAFCRHGNPNGPGLPAWPAYTTARRDTMRFAASPCAVADPDSERRRAWDGCFEDQPQPATP